MRNYLVVSGATAGSRYVGCLLEQGVYLSERGIPYRGYVVKPRGSWGENTKIKPEVFRMAWGECETVLWVDSDCTVDPPEELPPGDWDVAVTDNIHPTHKIRISAGFILARRTRGAEAFMRRWEQNNRRASKDHPALYQTIREMRGRVKIGDMTDWLAGRHEINALAKDRGHHA